MNAIEDRLRDAYRAAADTVDPATIPSLALPTQPHASFSRRMRVLTPLAAAAAVTLVIVLATNAVGTAPRHHARTAKPRPAAAVSLPTFTLVDVGPSLKVYNTRTGAGLATIAPPSGQQFQAVAAGGPAGTYLAATGLTGSACHAYFYRFQLSASGQPSHLTLLRSVPDSQPTALTATADGGTDAFSTVHCATAPPNGGIDIRGRAGNRSWTYPMGDDYSFSLAATADGRTLAFSNYPGSGNGMQDELLNTQSTAPTTDGASRILSAVPPSDTLAISPDGQTLYTCAADGTTGKLAAYSTATGALIRVLHEWQVYSQFICQISADPTGRFLIAAVTADVSQPWTLTGFDVQASGTAVTLPVHPKLPFRGSQLAW